MKRAAPEQDRASQCAKNLRALNSAFCTWVQSRLTECPSDAWEADVRQYLAYLSELREDFSDVFKADAQGGGSQPPALAAVASATAPTSAGFSFGSGALTAGGRPTAASAAAPTAAPSTFAPPASSGFNFGAAPAFGVGGGFGTGQAALNPFAFPAAGGATNAAADEGEDEEPERPPSPSVVRSSAEDDGEELLFEEKCKLFFSEENAWTPRGFGTLQLRRPLDASAGGSARILMRNDTGKPMLNAKLWKGMKVTQLQGKSVCATLFNTTAQPGQEAPPTTSPRGTATMLRFKSDAEAAKLKQLMDMHAPK